ncbi:MAG TPA: transketolase [Terriglobia bacterium]|nr:transketolase [Terriglobia bacterium]
MGAQAITQPIKAAVNASPLDELSINTIRCLAIDAVQKADSGHPGLPMGTAAMAYALWTRFLRFNPRDPNWPNRDRFVLSAGHGCMLLYSLLHLTGYDLSLDEIKQFRQWGSKTPGHPERGLTPGVETTTGPLGQGISNAVGMAIAQKYLANYFNRPGHELLDYKVYGICSDGDLMEGVSAEAASIAGFLGLDNLIFLYDNNHITIEGSTDLAFSQEDVGKRFEAYGWFVQNLPDGNDLEAVTRALAAAKGHQGQPSLIIARTHIGYGSPNKHDTAAAHGEALGEEEVRLTKLNLGWPVEPAFFIPDEALVHFREAVSRGQQAEAEWQQKLAAYRQAFPELAKDWDLYEKGALPEGWAEKIPSFKAGDKPIATRSASEKVLAAIAPRLPFFLGGSADLAPSTKTYVKGLGDFSKANYGAKNFHFGIREHGMGAILNGMAVSGLIPYGATFLIFSDYCRPAIRLAALMEAHSIFVFTHDSVFLGEDGPTHEPIEHLPALRAIPHICLIRPGDANETAVAWRVAIEHRGGPVLLALTRQNLPIIDRSKYASAEGVARGAYVLADSSDLTLGPRTTAIAARTPKIILIASGSEVPLALESYEKLKEEGIAARVVSMPSWELFEKQPQSYRDEVLPPAVTARLAIEAAAPFGWERYVGLKGAVIGMNRFGASAPYKVLAEKFGFTSDNVVARAHELLGRQ